MGFMRPGCRLNRVRRAFEVKREKGALKKCLRLLVTTGVTWRSVTVMGRFKSFAKGNVSGGGVSAGGISKGDFNTGINRDQSKIDSEFEVLQHP